MGVFWKNRVRKKDERAHVRYFFNSCIRFTAKGYKPYCLEKRKV